MQAGQCGRCRAELGLTGRVCAHCRVDEMFLAWEVRLFSLQTRAMAAGQAVTAEEAIRRVSVHVIDQNRCIQDYPWARQGIMLLLPTPQTTHWQHGRQSLA